MAEAATKEPGDPRGPEQVKIPVRDGDGWRCPDCNGQLVGDVEREGVRCDPCSISWSVGFMEELLHAEKVPLSEALALADFPVCAAPDGSGVAICDGRATVFLVTAQAMLAANRIQQLAGEGLIRLKD